MTLPRPPLRWWVPVALLVFGTLLALLWLGQTLSSSYRTVERRGVQSARFLATFAGPQLEAFYRIGEPERAVGFLNRLNSDPAWLRVILVDPEGRVVYSSRFADEDAALEDVDADWLVSLEGPARRVGRDLVELGPGSDLVAGAFPVQMPEPGELTPGRRGVLLVERDLRGDKELARREAMLGFRSYLAALAGLCLLGWWTLDRLLARRLRRILEVTERLAHGERDARVGLSGRDELAAVGGAIDRMAERLEVAHRALAEREASFRELIEQGTDMIAVIARDGAIRFASPSARRILGLDPEAWVGRNVLELVHEDDRAAAVAALARALESGEPTPLIELRLRHADGRWVTLEVVGLSTPDRQARDEVVFNARDITDWKILQEQLRQAQKMEAVGLLAGGVAHDFNNLLTAVLGYCDLLEHDLAGQTHALPQVREIRVAGERGAELVRQLLAFGRKQVLSPREIDLNTVVLGMRQLVQRALGERIRLELCLADEPCWVRADRGQLEQVLLNLAVNARDAMPEGGRLAVSTAAGREAAALALGRVAPDEEVVALAVADDGPGIDPAILDRVFEPFFTTKGPGQGSGLGLATVHGIVHQSGGKVWVESGPREGATFRICLPRVEPPAESSEAVLPASGPGEVVRSAGTALVLEDDRAIRRLVVRGLEQAGYRVLEAEDVARARELLERHRDGVDLLVSDLVLPDGSGLTIAERVARTSATARIVLTSGYAAELTRGGAAVPSRSAFLPKPFAMSDLLAVVARNDEEAG